MTTPTIKPYTKSPATEAEVEAALLQQTDYYNRCNPSYEVSLEERRAKLAKAVAEGYKSEKCSCGSLMLAYTSFVRCDPQVCPFIKEDSKGLLDLIYGPGESDDKGV